MDWLDTWSGEIVCTTLVIALPKFHREAKRSLLIFSMIVVIFYNVYEKVSTINAVKLPMTMPIFV